VNRPISFAGLAFASALLVGAQCGQADRAPNAPANAPAPAQPKTPPKGLTTINGGEEPCALFPRDDATRMIGPFDGQPWIAKSMSDTKQFAGGILETTHLACMVRFAPRPGVPAGSIFAVEVLLDGAISFETGAAEMNGAARNMLNLIGAKTADGAQHAVDGWDYLGAYPREMTGRIGHVAFHADWEGVAVSLDSVEKILVKMRDAMFDLPHTALIPGSVAGENDPCSLVSRGEAEAILGPLAVPPYESRDFSAFADSAGTGCSFYSKNHHVLSIRPWWSHGKAVFNVIGATKPIASPIIGIYDAWEKAASDPVGNFYFLKGDQLLGVTWKTSTTDQNGAIRIAAVAMRKLAK